MLSPSLRFEFEDLYLVSIHKRIVFVGEDWEIGIFILERLKSSDH